MTYIDWRFEMFKWLFILLFTVSVVVMIFTAITENQNAYSILALLAIALIILSAKMIWDYGPMPGAE